MILERRVPGAMSALAPAIVLDEPAEAHHLAWTDIATEQMLFASAPLSGNTTVGQQPDYAWSAPQIVPSVQTDSAPTMAQFLNATWLAFKQPGAEAALWIMQRNGQAWSSAMRIPGAVTGQAPALAATPTALYAFWTDAYLGVVAWSKTTDGRTWAPVVRVEGALSGAAPMACAGGGIVYVAWQARANPQQVFWSASTDGVSFFPAPRQVAFAEPGLGFAIGSGPFDQLEVIWRVSGAASLTDPAIFRTSLTNFAQNTWSTGAQVPTVVTSGGIGVASGDFLMAWTGLRGHIYVGPMLQLGAAAPTKADAQIYRFSLPTFQILQTRAPHTDTDFAAIAASNANGRKQALSQAMGSLNNGTYPTTLFVDVQFADTDSGSLTYSIVNSGHSAPSDIETAVQGAVTKLAEEGASALANELAELALDSVFGLGELISVIEQEVPAIGEALDKLADWLVQQLFSVIDANCDGPVAGGIHFFTGLDLRQKTASDQVWLTTDVNTGTPSADGCGAGVSLYNVVWTVAVSPLQA